MHIRQSTNILNIEELVITTMKKINMPIGIQVMEKTSCTQTRITSYKTC